MAIHVTEQNFDTEVIERSYRVPVLVDFWAEWCGPCRSLGPVLDQVTTDREGEVVLAKVNTEASPQLAARYGIRSIPAVKLFRDGVMVDEFVGALPRTEVERFLDRNRPSAADDHVKRALQRRDAGDTEGAVEALEQALAVDPAHRRAHLERARAALAQRDADTALRHVEAIPPGTDEALEAGALRAFAELLAQAEAGDPDTWRARLAEDDTDPEAHFALGVGLAVAGQHRDALEHLLHVLSRPRAPHRTEAHRAMLAVFGLVGRQDPLVSEFERRLQILL